MKQHLPFQFRLESTVTICVLLATVVIYAFQFRSLYTVPVYDSVRWGGDETWLMREFGNQASHGAMSYPESFGESPRTDGVLAGSMWFNALIYGETGNLLSPTHDLISTGRTVTALLGFLLIGSVFYLQRRLGITPVLASLMTALLVMNRGFVWATHCARYDLLTGIALIWYCFYLAKLSSNRLGSKASAFLFGVLSVSVIIFSRHLLTLALPATLLTMFYLRIWRTPRFLVAWASGLVAAAGLLSIAYAVGAGEFSLFGRGGALGSYSFVLQQLPILRPFSRNVQVSNLIERAHLFWSDAPGVTVLLFLCVAFGTVLLIWRLARSLRATSRSETIAPNQRFMLIATVGCSISWLLLQGSRPYYLFHIVPLLTIGCAIVLQSWQDILCKDYRAKAIGTCVALALIGLQVSHAIPSTDFGEAVARDQKAAIQRLLSSIPKAGGPKHRILVDVAGLNWALMDTSLEVLTLDMFQPPADAEAAISKLNQNRIDYVILRSSPVGGAFEPGRGMLPNVLDSIGVVQDAVVGFFYDDGRNYDAGLDSMNIQGCDTLKLYKLHPSEFNSAKP